MTASLLILLWACSAVMSLAITAFAFDEVQVLHLVVCIMLPPPSAVASCMFLAQKHPVVWRRRP